MKKRLIVVGLALSLVMTGALVALANEVGTGVIEFEDSRLGDGVIIVDPGPGGGGYCGDCGDEDCVFCNLDDEGRGLLSRGSGLDFWSHDLRNVQNAIGGTITFNSRRAENDDWDIYRAVGPQEDRESFAGLYFASNDQEDLEVWVAMGGFFLNGSHVLVGHSMELVIYEYLDSDNIVFHNFYDSIFLLAGADGILGPGAPANTAVQSDTSAAVLYEGVLVVPRGQVLNETPIGQSVAEIMWSLVSS
jgi:hypothetical protein